MTRVEEIRCKTVPSGTTGEYGLVPEESVSLRPGDYTTRELRNGVTWILVHRVGLVKRLWHGLRKR